MPTRSLFGSTGSSGSSGSSSTMDYFVFYSYIRSINNLIYLNGLTGVGTFSDIVVGGLSLLSDFVTNSDLTTILATYVTSAYLTANYVTGAFIAATYVTSAYLTANYVTGAFIASTYATIASLSSYVTTAYLTANYVTASYISSTYATIASLSSYVTTAYLTANYVTASFISSTYATIASLSSYVTLAYLTANYVTGAFIAATYVTSAFLSSYLDANYNTRTGYPIAVGSSNGYYSVGIFTVPNFNGNRVKVSLLGGYQYTQNTSQGGECIIIASVNNNSSSGSLNISSHYTNIADSVGWINDVYWRQNSTFTYELFVNFSANCNCSVFAESYVGVFVVNPIYVVTHPGGLGYTAVPICQGLIAGMYQDRTNGDFAIRSTAIASSSAYALQQTTTGATTINTATSQPLVFSVNNVEKMRLSSAGNVGINTNAPSFLLDINGSMHALTINLNGADLQSVLNLKALDSTCLHLSANETASGVKHFTSGLIVDKQIPITTIHPLLTSVFGAWGTVTYDGVTPYAAGTGENYSLNYISPGVVDVIVGSNAVNETVGFMLVTCGSGVGAPGFANWARVFGTSTYRVQLQSALNGSFSFVIF